MVDVIVITGRTTDQGVTIDEKLSEEYVKAVAFCEMNEDDMRTIGVREGEKVKVKTDFGEVVLFAKKAVIKDLELPKGVVFIPMGPYANQVVGRSTGSGTPQFKGVRGTVKPVQEDIKPVEELLKVVK